MANSLQSTYNPTIPSPLVSAGPSELSAPGLLSAAQEREYADRGFLAIADFCGKAELEWMRRTLLELFERRAGRAEGAQFDMLGPDADPGSARQPQIIKPSVFVPALVRTEYVKQLSVIARQLLGSDGQLSFDHSVLKPANSGAATPWHQDEAHHDHRYLRYRQVSFWLALQDTPEEKGCMRYIPFSHRGPLLPHRPLADDPRVHAMECSREYFDESRAVVIPATAGSCILHDGRTLHSALPNLSGAGRIAYIVAFAVPAVTAGQRPSPSLTRATASGQRRKRWLLHGGFAVQGLRRLRQGLRSSPRSHWRKLCILMRIMLERSISRSL